LGLKNGFPVLADLTATSNLVNILVLSIFCSSLAFIFLVRGVQVLGLGKSMIFCNLIPVITAIISFFLLNEEFTIPKISGIAIVITGIFIVQKK
jgi:drug/metabolite transporter (DMT)-like permease